MKPPPMPPHDPNRLSFLPEDYISRRKEQRTNLICLSLFGIVLIGVVGAYMVTKTQRAQVLQTQAEVNAKYAEAANRLAQLNELQQRKQELLHKALITSTLVEPVPRSNLLAELINRMPGTLSLKDLSLTSTKLAAPKPAKAKTQSTLANARDAAMLAQEQQKPEPPPAPRYQVTLTMVGIAPTDIQVAQYMASLARCGLIEDMDLSYSEAVQVDDMPMRRFKIIMRLNVDADIRAIDPLRTAPRNTFGRPMMQATVDTLIDGDGE